MRFSVVIPVYGTERFLPRCLNSLKAQTDRDLEVIGVDNCSPGDCAEVVGPAFVDGCARILQSRTRRLGGKPGRLVAFFRRKPS